MSSTRTRIKRKPDVSWILLICFFSVVYETDLLLFIVRSSNLPTTADYWPSMSVHDRIEKNSKRKIQFSYVIILKESGKTLVYWLTYILIMMFSSEYQWSIFLNKSRCHIIERELWLIRIIKRENILLITIDLSSSFWI